MNPLSTQELEERLQTQSPEQIRKHESNRLDEAGLALLAKMDQDLARVDAFSEETGQRFREHMPPLPELKLPKPRWWDRVTAVSNGRLAAVIEAAASAFIFLLILAQGDYLKLAGGLPDDEILRHTRGGPVGTPQIEPLNDALYEALMNRGIRLYEIGKQEGKRELLEDALFDLLRARELREDEVRVDDYLALTYEALGRPGKADGKREQVRVKGWFY